MKTIKKLSKDRINVYVSMVIIVIILVCYIRYVAQNSPQPCTMNISSFGGRVIPEDPYQSRPDVFLIEEPFPAAITWGSDAIMIYGRCMLRIYKPDQKTQGSFLYSEHEVTVDDTPWNRFWWGISKITYDISNKQVIIHPTCAVWLVAVMFILVCVFCLMLISVIRNS